MMLTMMMYGVHSIWSAQKSIDTCGWQVRGQAGNTKTENQSPLPVQLSIAQVDVTVSDVRKVRVSERFVNHTKFCLKRWIPLLQSAFKIKCESKGVTTHLLIDGLLVCATKSSWLTQPGLPQTHLRQVRMPLPTALATIWVTAAWQPRDTFKKCKKHENRCLFFPVTWGFLSGAPAFWFCFGSGTFALIFKSEMLRSIYT